MLFHQETENTAIQILIALKHKVPQISVPNTLKEGIDKD